MVVSLLAVAVSATSLAVASGAVRAMSGVLGKAEMQLRFQNRLSLLKSVLDDASLCTTTDLLNNAKIDTALRTEQALTRGPDNARYDLVTSGELMKIGSVRGLDVLDFGLRIEDTFPNSTRAYEATLKIYDMGGGFKFDFSQEFKVAVEVDANARVVATCTQGFDLPGVRGATGPLRLLPPLQLTAAPRLADEFTESIDMPVTALQDDNGKNERPSLGVFVTSCTNWTAYRYEVLMTRAGGNVQTVSGICKDGRRSRFWMPLPADLVSMKFRATRVTSAGRYDSRRDVFLHVDYYK